MGIILCRLRTMAAMVDVQARRPGSSTAWDVFGVIGLFDGDGGFVKASLENELVILVLVKKNKCWFQGD
ncbi:MAG: hypothetical protein KJ638_05590 [Chloroflexi bacterium]|nr:hypothetical protein [Chloroflexota bacterium]